MAKKAARKPAAKKAAAKKVAVKKAPPRRAAAAARKPAAPKWKPKEHQDVMVSLALRDAAAAIEFYKKALGAQELGRHTMPGSNTVMHAEIRIGDTVIAMADEMPGSPATAAGPNHRPSAVFMLYTPDCDALFRRAVEAGAQPGMPVADQFWGDRMGSVSDPFGQVWMIATRKREMSADELRKAGDEFAAQMAAGQQQPAPAAH